MKRAALSVLLAIALLPLGTALAHSKPTIRVEPAIVAAGGTLTVIGKDMEAGAEFTITLDRSGRSIKLGLATAKGEPDEAGFTASFTVPADTTPGSYVVRAQSDKVSALADLTVTAPAAQATAGPATMALSAAPAASEAPMASSTPMPSATTGAGAPHEEEATAEEHKLPRQRPAGELAGAIGALVVLAGVGAWLVRSGA